ncbi:MAG: Holliday junction branch migration protein RuvA [Gemmatimonadota bacterium]
MICQVRGEFLGLSNGRVRVATASGLSYEILVPPSVLGSLPARGSSIELHTSLVVRDDSMELFGFSTEADRELFGRLQSASGVGPRLALAILGALPSSRIVAAIRARDHSVLQTVSGVGRKTAERLALELADKMDDLATSPAAPVTTDSSAALEALRALGYSPSEGEAALAGARSELAGRDADAEELVRAALRRL